MTRLIHTSHGGRLLDGVVLVLCLLAAGHPVAAQDLLGAAGDGLAEPIDRVDGAEPRHPPLPVRGRSEPVPESSRPTPPEPSRFPLGEPGVALVPEGIEWGEEPIETAQYVEETTRTILPQAEIRGEIDREIEARLAGIPRPRYIPATDFAPPRGLLLHREDTRRGEFPFALAVSGFLQLRWLEFARGATTWTNSAGTELPISNINAFSLNRYLLMFAGHVVDERLVYSFALFGTSNNGINTGVAPLGLAGWKFGPGATVGMGVLMVPGSREFIDGSPWTLGVDRSMANTFFRPGVSPGAAAIGTLGTLHYQAGVFNSIDAGGANVILRRGTSMAWAGNVWWEPLGKFGLGYSDMEHHADPAIRVGTTGVFSPNTRALPVPGFNPENTIVRLSDGTPLATPNALGPGATVDTFDYRLATVDAGWKWRGVSANAEYYVRFLDAFSGSGTFDRAGILDQGGAGYLGWAFIPRTWEVYARSSAVTGPFGSGKEYGGGINRYVNKSRQGRLTLEAIHMLRNPAQNILYPYRAGATGTAIQTQFVVAF